jgi:hypothetical protein
VTPEHGSAKKRAKKSVRKKILTAQDPGREALEASMRELRALVDANMKAQVQAWQTPALGSLTWLSRMGRKACARRCC